MRYWRFKCVKIKDNVLFRGRWLRFFKKENFFKFYLVIKVEINVEVFLDSKNDVCLKNIFGGKYEREMKLKI